MINKSVKNMAMRNMAKSLSENNTNLLRLLHHSVKNPASVSRNINYYEYSKQKLNESHISYTPTVFVATITDDCNLRCPNCLYLLENPDKFFKSRISPEEFRQTLEKYNPQKKAEVIFLSGGEPLSHPQFGELVDISLEYNLTPKISTNGILVKKKMPSLAKLDYINVSMDSYDYESFRKYRGGTNKQFDVLHDSLIALRDSEHYFSLSFVLSKENVAEIDKMIAFAEAYKPNFIYFHNINPHGCDEFSALTVHDKETMSILSRVLERTDYQADIRIQHVFDTDSANFKDRKCIQPWQYFCFNSRGDVSYCCHLEHDQEIGNVFQNYDYNSPKMVEFREDIVSGKISGSCLYCQRRFLEDQEFATFDASKKEWYTSKEIKKAV